MDWIGLFGDPFFWFGVSLVLLTCYRFIPKGKRRMALKFIFLVVPAAGLGYGMSQFLKVFFAIPRPCAGLEMCPQEFSMPSTHATVAFSALGTLGSLTTPWVLLIAAIVAVSRVWLGVHTWADITVGAILGLALAITINQLYKEEFERQEDGNKKSKRGNKNIRDR